MIDIANLSFDAVGDKNLTYDADGQKNLTANHAPVPYNEEITMERTNTSQWTFSWTSSDAPFQIYLQGELLASTSDNSYVYVSDDEIAPEVYTSSVTQDPYTVINKPRAVLQWYSPAEQKYYADRFVSPSWRRQRGEIGSRDIGYETTNTGYLGDDLEETWRIVPLNEWETEGTGVEHEFNVVSHPEPPVYSATITSGDLVIGSV